jgi:hypothetical protein
MMTPEAKKGLSSTIRGLRQRLLEDLRLATESAYRLSVRAQEAGLDEAAKTKRQRLDSWLDEQLRAQAAGGRRRQRDDFLREAEQQAAYTLLNRLVILRLMEEPGSSGQPLRKPALIKGGWGSTAYQDFRDLARGVVRGDPTEGFGFLLQLVFEELSEDLPGLFGSAGIGDLISIPPATLRHAVEELNKDELESCWADDMTLGWVYQYWNDPERERLDAKINDGGKIEPHGHQSARPAASWDSIGALSAMAARSSTSRSQSSAIASARSQRSTSAGAAGWPTAYSDGRAGRSITSGCNDSGGRKACSGPLLGSERGHDPQTAQCGVTGPSIPTRCGPWISSSTPRLMAAESSS